MTATHPRRVHRDERRLWWLLFSLIVICLLAWAATMPLFSAPDEPAHVVRAVSLSHGALAPSDAERQEPEQWGAFGSWAFNHASEVQIAEIYRSAGSVGCYAFLRNVTADCAHFAGSGRSAAVLTTAGRHPPAYYAVIGFLTRLLPDRTPKIYLMRAISAALTAALLASAFLSTRRFENPRVAALGPAVALTPMVFFVGGAVNPSGVEIAAAIGLWVGIAAISQMDGSDVDGRLIARCGVAAIALVLARPLGPLWLGLLAGFALGLWGVKRLRALIALRSTRMWCIAISAAAVSQIAWIANVGTLDTSNSNTSGFDESLSRLARVSFGFTWVRSRDMVGNFGWLDTPVPATTLVVWFLALGILLALAYICAPASGQLRYVSVCLVLVVLVPVLLEAPKAQRAGFFWQGRYTLPLAVGIPILLAAIASRKPAETPDPLRSMVRFVGCLLVVGQALAFAQAQRRFMVGYDGRFDFWLHAAWTPPLPAVLGFATFVAAYTALIWPVILRRPSPTGTSPPGSAAPPSSTTPALHR